MTTLRFVNKLPIVLLMIILVTDVSELNSASSLPFVIAGFVRFADDKPAEGVEVLLKAEEGNVGTRLLETNKNGRFEFQLTPPHANRFKLLILPFGFEYSNLAADGQDIKVIVPKTGLHLTDRRTDRRTLLRTYLASLSENDRFYCVVNIVKFFDRPKPLVSNSDSEILTTASYEPFKYADDPRTIDDFDGDRHLRSYAVFRETIEFGVIPLFAQLRDEHYDVSFERASFDVTQPHVRRITK